MGTEIVEPARLRRGVATTDIVRSLREPSANTDSARREPLEEGGGGGVLAGVDGAMIHGRGISWNTCASFLDILLIMNHIKTPTRRRAPTPPTAAPSVAELLEEVEL